MPYTNTSKLLAATGPDWLLAATDDDGDGVADAAIIDEVVALASNQIDAALESRYNVPISDPVPGIIGDIATWISVEALAARRPPLVLTVGQQAQVTALREILEGLQKGHLALPGVSSKTQPQFSTGSSNGDAIDRSDYKYY